MSKSNITFSQEQLEYIRSKYITTINYIITPDSTMNTIQYNAGILAVITSIEERTHGVIPTRPR